MTVLLLTMILSALGTAMTSSGQTELMVARNTVSAAQSHAAAESGLNHAVELTIPNLQQFVANGFPSVSAAITVLLAGPDGLTGTPATDADNGSLENLGIPRPPAVLALGAANGVTYEARIFDDDDPARGTALTAADIARIGEDNDPTTDANSTLAIQAIGYALDNTTVTLESTLVNNTTQLPAIVTGGDLIISGNPDILGSQGGVHANGCLDIPGNPNIAQQATASGAYTISGSPTIGGVSGGGHATVPVPPVNAIDYRPNADFILTSGGRMTGQMGNVICDASADSAACQASGYDWVYLGVNGWSAEGNGVTAGTYYVEGEVSISGNHGTAADPWATVIAEGSIQTSGVSNIAPDTPELLFVTDGDLTFSGDPGTYLTVAGAILVHEQLELAGDPTVSGRIIVEDAGGKATSKKKTNKGKSNNEPNGLLGGDVGACTEADEDVTIAHDPVANTITLRDNNIDPAPVVMTDTSISALLFTFLDVNRAVTADPNAVAFVGVSVTAQAQEMNAQTGLFDTTTLTSEVRLRSR